MCRQKEQHVQRPSGKWEVRSRKASKARMPSWKRKLVQNETREADCGPMTQCLRVPIIYTLVFTLSDGNPLVGLELGNDVLLSLVLRSFE